MAISKPELATAISTSGGIYVYIERAFGLLFGTISGIGLWLSLLLKISFALVGFGAYITVLAYVPLRSVALAFLLVILGLNILGVKEVGNVQLLIATISLIGLGLLLVFGLPSVDSMKLLSTSPLSQVIIFNYKKINYYFQDFKLNCYSLSKNKNIFTYN